MHKHPPETPSGDDPPAAAQPPELAAMEGSGGADAQARPPPPPIPAGASLPPATAHEFEFRGTASEYFRIWIVNLALSVLTLGIFSAWAKVRSERWFYGNTWVAGAPFEYLAQPIPILKGRIVDMAFLGSYVLLGQFAPIGQPILLLLVAIATPWLVVNGMRFRARYSAWRTLNFRFTGTVADAFKYYFLMFMLLLPTLGMVFPYLRYAQRKFTVEEHRFGGHRLEFEAKPGDFYTIYLLGWLIGGGAMVAAAVAAGVWLGGALSSNDGKPDMEAAQMVGFVIVGITYAAMFIGWAFIAARVTNITFNCSRIGPHGLQSTIRSRDLLALYLTNTLAILASVGMLVPWAQVRMARYRAAHMALLERGNVLDSRAESRAGLGAAGAETANVFDVDLSL